MDDLEVIKENVQPLRQGRKIETLKAALNFDCSLENDKREAIREKFEMDIRQLKNDELFETYHNYINWIEQNYPKGGKEANLCKTLEACIQTFYKQEKFRNNEKMLSIFLKYTNIVTDPISVFDFFYKVGFAKQLSHFYIDWAYHLEMQNNFKKALQVIKIGIKNQAQPLSDLKRTLNDLEVRTLRFVSNNPEDSNNQRKALNKLKTYADSHGKVIAPIKRTAIDANDGLKKVTANVKNKNNESLDIYVEKGNIDNQDVNENDPNFNQTSKENEIKIDKWAGNMLDLKKSVQINNNKFDIFVDSNANDKSNKKEPKIPVAIFEDKEILKKYIWYDRINEIYRDGTEYSFEELRYAKWLEEQARKQHSASTQQITNTTKEPDSKFLNDTEMIRYFFNGTLYNTFSQTTQLEKSLIVDTRENFEIMNEMTNHENESNDNHTKNADTSFVRTTQFKSCSSSTPFINKTLKSKHNLATRLSYNNSNFVNGITSKLSTIVETSREDYSKSSSSSSGTISNVGHTLKKIMIDLENINPFDSNNRQILLASFFQNSKEFRKSFLKIHSNCPTFDISKRFNINDQQYIIIEQLSKKDTEEIYLFQKMPANFDLDSIINFEFYSLKVCHNLDYWEFYIYDDLERRLVQNKSTPDIELSLLTLDRIICYQDGYLLFHDLNLNFSIEKILERLRSKQTKFSLIIILFALELILIIQKLHNCDIIHSNISIENIVLSPITKDEIDLLPQRTFFTKLVDFSQAIDMRVLPDDITFEKNYKNDQLYEILNMKPWNYLIDWIGFLNCIHIMAFNSKLKIIKQPNGKWKMENSFDQNLSILNELSLVLLNLEPNQKPNLETYVNSLTSLVKQNKTELREQLIQIFLV